MPGYSWRAFSIVKKRPGVACGIHDGDWWDLTGLVKDLEDAARYKEPLEEGLKVPTQALVDALPDFDPEQFLLLGENKDWKPYGKGGDARWCSPATLAKYAKTMKALDPCVGDHAARAAWDRYRDAVTKLASKKQGLYCSIDE